MFNRMLWQHAKVQSNRSKENRYYADILHRLTQLNSVMVNSLWYELNLNINIEAKRAYFDRISCLFTLA